MNNEEIMYPFKRGCCLDCCTRKLSNNSKSLISVITKMTHLLYIGKKCSAIAFFFAILFLAGSIACLVLVAKYPEVLTENNDNITLYIPSKSAVKLNLTDYNISTIKRDQLTIAAASNAGKEHKGLVTIAATHTRKEKECTDADKIITKRTYEYNKTETKSILRYWPSSSHVSVNISIHHNSPNHDNHITAWKWGALSNPPPDVSCEAIKPKSTIMDGTTNERKIDDKIIFFDKKPKKNNHMIRITFCNKNPNIITTANIEIEECVALPKRALCKYIYIDDTITEEPNPVEVQFQSLFSEMLKHSMLYIDTRHMSSSSDEADKELQLELQPQTSGSNPLKEIVIAITIISFIASILFFSLGFFCLCCCRRKEFCGCGVYYQNKRV